MVTPIVLVGALLVAGPSLWRAGQGQLAVDTALTHFLLAVVLVAAGRALLRAVVGAYARPVAGPRTGSADRGAGTAKSAASASSASSTTTGRSPRRRHTDAEQQPTPGIP